MIMNNAPKNEVIIKKYIYSILIDWMIFFALLIGLFTLYDTISSWFGVYGKYFFWINIIAAILFHIFSDTTFKFQSFGKWIFKINIHDKNGKKAFFISLAIRRIIELPILLKKNKEIYFDKVSTISNTLITLVNTEVIN